MAKKSEQENAGAAKNKGEKRKNSAKKPSKKSAPRAGGAPQEESGGKSIKSARPAGTPRASRRKRSDGIAAAVEIAQASMREIEPPAHVRLRKRDDPFFDSIIAEFAKVEWTDHTLELAALLARAISDLEMEQDMMRREGSILKNIKMVPIEPGNPDAGEREVVTGTYVNPRKQLMDMHSKNILAWRRSLSLHARVKDGEPRDIKKRRGAAKDIEDGIAGLDDKMNLIARPQMVQ